MFASIMWQTSKFVGKNDAMDVEHTILVNTEFWKANNYFLKCVTIGEGFRTSQW